MQRLGENLVSFTLSSRASQHSTLYPKIIILNDLQGKIIPLQVTLSNTSELILLIYADIAAGSSMHAMEHSPKVNAVFQPTISYKLDDFIEQFKIKLPNHMKIDVDGAELNVVTGAGKTLRDSHLKSLLIEIDEKLDSNKKVLELIKSTGLRVTKKHPKRSEATYNYIFTRP